MKLSKSTAFCVVLLLFLAVGAEAALTARQSQSNIKSKSGFRGLKWGASISEHEYAVPSDFIEVSRTKHFCEYMRKDEKLSLGDVPLESIIYSFVIVDGVEKFHKASMPLFPGDESKIVNILTKQYGEFRKEIISSLSQMYIFEDDYVMVFFVTGEDLYLDEVAIYSKEMKYLFREASEKSKREVNQRAADF